jgi:hypothetical protein
MTALGFSFQSTILPKQLPVSVLQNIPYLYSIGRKRHVQSTDHELIPARYASLAAMHGSASGNNIRYYPT